MLSGMALLDLPDGRTLEYVVTGAPAGMPLVLHHGTPGAAVVYPPVVARDIPAHRQ